MQPRIVNRDFAQYAAGGNAIAGHIVIVDDAFDAERLDVGPLVGIAQHDAAVQFFVHAEHDAAGGHELFFVVDDTEREHQG